MIGGVDLEQLEVASLYLFGDIKFLDLLLLMMVIDIFSGWTKALFNKNLWSRKTLFGLARKIMILTVIIVANVIDQILDMNGIVAGATLLFYIVNEGLSILENLAQIGVPIPKFVVDKLHLIRDQSDNFKEEVSAELLGKEVNNDLEETSVK